MADRLRRPQYDRMKRIGIRVRQVSGHLVPSSSASSRCRRDQAYIERNRLAVSDFNFGRELPVPRLAGVDAVVCRQELARQRQRRGAIRDRSSRESFPLVAKDFALSGGRRIHQALSGGRCDDGQRHRPDSAATVRLRASRNGAGCPPLHAPWTWNQRHAQ